MNSFPTLIISGDLWEIDFVVNDLFPKNGVRVLIANPESFIDIDYYDKNNVEKGNCCLMFSSNNIEFKYMLKIVQYVNPLIILHMSDEEGNNAHYLQLALYTKLYLKQYHSIHYDYSKYKNIRFIPLGYMKTGTDYFLNKKIKLSTERFYQWSFIGNQEKSDRPQVLNIMSQSSLTKFCLGNNINTTQMFDIYSESIFVINCRGNVTLDCFRTYEGSACGAIPVVVGDKIEVENTYLKEEYPPWLFATNWNEAIEKCEFLINNPKLLIEQQEKVVLWWKSRVNNCHILIKNVLDS
jgi:hypothetical protein